ncbi:hypothetical protein IAT40_001469 [Kwoniella sp. CBS 6097]
MISQPGSFESSESFYTSTTSPSLASFPDSLGPIAQVPDPRTASPLHNRTPSPYAQARSQVSQHHRSLSETSDFLRPRAGFESTLQPLSEMLHSQKHQQHPPPPPYPGFQRPSSPLGVATNQFPVGGAHSHSHASTSYGSSSRYQSMTAAFGHQGSASAGSTPAQATFPHHLHGPHGLAHPHAGPSDFRRQASASALRSHITQRVRAASGGHDRHLRCAPDCAAAEAPYHFLSTVIGRASINDFHKTTVRAIKRKAPRDEDIEMDEQPAVRPNIQTRRSRARTSSIQGPVTPPFQEPVAQNELKPLAFDRKWMMSTPPLPPVDHMRDPPRGGDFFADYSQPNINVTSNAVLFHGTEPIFDFDIPRSSSAPAVPLVGTRDRGFSDASAGSTASIDVPTMQAYPRYPMDGNAPRMVEANMALPYVTSPERLPTTRATEAPGAGRFANFTGRRLDPGEKLHSIGQLVGDPNELTMYLGEDLAATLRQRMQPDPSGTEKVAKRKEEVLNEAEWSFDIPLHKALGESVRGWLTGIPDQESYHIAEYGCVKETPSSVLAEAIRSLCIRSLGPGRPKKVVTVTHQCDADFDTRLLQANLASDPASYRKIKAIPSPLVLTSFSFADFAETALPPNSVDLAISAGELSKIHGIMPPKPVYMFSSRAEEREQRADKDFSGWLRIRAKEIKPGGVLACSFAIRTSPAGEYPERNGTPKVEQVAQPPQASPYNYSASLPTSPRTSLDGHNTNTSTTPMTEVNRSPFVSGQALPSPPATNGRARRYRPDIWQAMSHALSPAIQRLVSLGEIKTQVAPLLVDVPFWPRTLDSMQMTLSRLTEWDVLSDPSSAEAKMKGGEAMLRSSSEESEVMLHEYAGDAYSPEEKKEWADAGVRIVRLSHPAWRAFREGRIDRAAYARRIAMYCRSVYESHLKKVLRERGRMDISQCETTVQELFKVLVEKCELGALDALEIDVGIVVLRRKS